MEGAPNSWGLTEETTLVCRTPCLEAPRAPPGLILLQEGVQKLEQEAVNGLCIILTCHRRVTVGLFSPSPGLSFPGLYKGHFRKKKQKKNLPHKESFHLS